MRGDSWNRARKGLDIEERKGAAKARARFARVVAALGLDHEEGVACVVSTCRALSLRPCAEGKGYFCPVCGDKGDMIDLVRVVRDCGMTAAVEFLEHVAEEADAKTGRLL